MTITFFIFNHFVKNLSLILILHISSCIRTLYLYKEVIKINSKFKVLFTLLLSFTLIFCIPIQASSTNKSSASAKQYIDQLSLIQNQIFSLAQKVLFYPHTGNEQTVQVIFDGINHSLDTLYKTIVTELQNENNNENDNVRTLRLILNALNYMSNSLYELEQISNTNDTVQKMCLLQYYFTFRVYADNTLKFVSDTLS